MEAIEHLPDGMSLVIHDFTWADYERLLNDLAHRPHLRVSYDEGKLEIMSPLPEHEDYARFIDDLVRAVADALGVELEKRGGATWKSRRLARGVEPDACYYVTSAARIIGKRTIDFDTDPPPDVVVEIDVTNESLAKFGIYAALGVPEIWRYDTKSAQFYALTEGSYLGIPDSRFLRGLTPALLVEALEQSKKDGQTRALAAFRRRFESFK